MLIGTAEDVFREWETEILAQEARDVEDLSPTNVYRQGGPVRNDVEEAGEGGCYRGCSVKIKSGQDRGRDSIEAGKSVLPT